MSPRHPCKFLILAVFYHAKKNLFAALSEIVVFFFNLNKSKYKIRLLINLYTPIWYISLGNFAFYVGVYRITKEMWFSMMIFECQLEVKIPFECDREEFIKSCMNKLFGKLQRNEEWLSLSIKNWKKKIFYIWYLIQTLFEKRDFLCMIL